MTRTSAQHAATAVAVAALTACSGVPASGLPQPVARPFAQDVKRSLAYVSQEAENSIGVFRLDGKRIRTITGDLSYPQGIFADAGGTLYVANRGSNDILEFRPGATSPFKVLRDEKNQPEDVMVCPNGTLYVANILNANGGGGNIAVYAHGSRTPTGSLTYGGGSSFLSPATPGGTFLVR